MCSFSKNLPFINFWGKFHPKICCSPYLLKSSVEVWCNSVNLETTRWEKICSYNFEQENFEKLELSIIINIIIMYNDTKFQSIGQTTSDFRSKFAQNYINDKTFKKINVKIVININFKIRMQQCMPVPNLSPFEEL